MSRRAATLSPAIMFAIVFATLVAATSSAEPPDRRVSALLAKRAGQKGVSRVIIMAGDAASLPAALDAVKRGGGKIKRLLPLIDAQVAELPNAAIRAIAANPAVAAVALDRTIAATMERTSATVGAAAVRRDFGYDGAGVGIAIIDSGVTSWHDDLADEGTQRVDRFVDFVNGRATAYDDYGHGTHVAGIIAGNGFDSDGARTGIAPRARIIALKALDANGAGRISDVIAALDYAVANRAALNIRVVNLSIAAGVYDSYESDPLTLAARRAVDAGIVVVAAAGNYGRDRDGRPMYGGVGAPGNAPWVLTVGASSHMGTVERDDDTIGAFSSRGPSAIDAAAKPDIVAPGVGIESLADPTSTLYATESEYLLAGTVATSYLPYLSQSGTSMSAPVVSGTVALMLQANPSLTPNAVKAILQYTAQPHADYDTLTEGAVFLNAAGAVRLARYFADPSGERPTSDEWSGRVIWGNRMISGGRLSPNANAWSGDVVWGARTTSAGQLISWGDICRFEDCDSGDHQWSRWRITCSDDGCGSKWSNGASQNVVWGSRCSGANCDDLWAFGLFSASDAGDTVVWGTSGEGDTVVWGTTDTGDTVVWGTACTDSSCAPVLWKR
jgi:subtilisin family serine protease